MQKLKLIVSFSFLIFLFLPLTQCTQTEIAVDATQTEANLAQQQASPPIQESETESVEAAPRDLPSSNLRTAQPESGEDVEPGVGTILAVLGVVVLPFASCFLKPSRFRLKVASNLLQLLIALGFSYLVYIRVYDMPFMTPLVSGHILMVLSAVFALLSLATLCGLIGSRHNKPNNNAPAAPDAASRAGF